jgi:hypothetical protein
MNDTTTTDPGGMLPVVGTGDDLATRMRYAEALAGARLLPGPYRRSPADVLLAVEYAAALGLAPVTALTSIHVVDGRPTMSAELMRALVARAGHVFRIVESTADRCVVEVARRESPDERTRFAWTLDDAHRAGLLPARDSSGWVRYPASMLLARATSAACRAVFADVLAGVSYTPDELGPVPGASDADDAAAVVVVGELVDRHSDPEPVDAELVEPDHGPEPAPDVASTRAGSSPPERPRTALDATRDALGTPRRHYPPSDGQLRAINARCRAAGVRDVIHRGYVVAAVLDLPAPVASLRDLTTGQARAFLDATADAADLAAVAAATHAADLTDDDGPDADELDGDAS